MSLLRRRGPSLEVRARRGPWLRSLLERLDDLDASDLFGELDPEIPR